jgi:hypothetical protein
LLSVDVFDLFVYGFLQLSLHKLMFGVLFDLRAVITKTVIILLILGFDVWKHSRNGQCLRLAEGEGWEEAIG